MFKINDTRKSFTAFTVRKENLGIFQKLAKFKNFKGNSNEKLY